MIRKQVLEFLETEIERVSKRLQELAQEKSGVDGPKTSWHDAIHLVIERDIDIQRGYLERCQRTLAFLQNHVFSGAVGNGSIVILELGGERNTYIVVSTGGASIGDYAVLSARSPIGEAIWGKRAGVEVNVITPGGEVTVKILKIA